MIYRIYQLSPSLFFKYRYGKSSVLSVSNVEFGLEDYCCIWYDKVENLTSRKDLTFEQIVELLFVEFNANVPEHFGGHSLSTSDIVEFIDEVTGRIISIYRCENFGWTRLEFNS